MKAKKFRLMAVLAALLVTMSLQAQVTIGSLEPPQKGAILDLNNGAKGGLLFSNVEIAYLTEIPIGFAGNPESDDKADLKGMVVYNASGNFPVGLYVWDGAKWTKLADKAAITLLEDAIETINSVSLPAKANTADVNQLVGSVSGLDEDLKPAASVVAGINKLNAKVGTLGSLATTEKTSVVSAINWLNNHVASLLTSSELEGSPFQSYAIFTDSLVKYQQKYQDGLAGKYAYVTFVSTDAGAIPPAWNGRVTIDHSWRLDCSSGYTFGPTADMTNAITALLIDGTATASLPGVGQSDVSTILQTYRNNLEDVYDKLTAHQSTINTKQAALNGTGFVKSVAGEISGEISYLPDPLPIANGGTGVTTAAAARNALGLGNTTDALPLLNGGTGAPLGNGTAGQVLTSTGTNAAKWAMQQDFYKGFITTNTNDNKGTAVRLDRANGTSVALTSYADFLNEPSGLYSVKGKFTTVAGFFNLPESSDGMLILMKWNNGTPWSQLEYLPEASANRYHIKSKAAAEAPAATAWAMDGGVISGELILVGNAPIPAPYRLRRSGNVVTLSGRCETLAAGVLSGNSDTWQVPANMRPSDTAYGQWYAIGYNGVSGSIESGPFILQSGGKITWRGKNGVGSTSNLTIPAVSQGFSFSISYIVDQ